MRRLDTVILDRELGATSRRSCEDSVTQMVPSELDRLDASDAFICSVAIDEAERSVSHSQQRIQAMG